MKYFLSFFFIISSLNAISLDIVDLYRTKGLVAVEKEIEEQLTKKSYWDYYLQNKDVSRGYYESIEYLMICQKNVKDIKLYDTKSQSELFNSDVFVGEIDGDKQVEGDLKTPVGVYKLKRRITNVDPFYGPLALTTNYPNLYDKSLGKTGHGIWIHGLPLNQERDDYTQGCIALDNTKIKNLDATIDIKNSILVISEDKLIETTKEDMSAILSNIFQWRESWKNSDIESYLSFYSSEFKKANGQSLLQFADYKKRVFKKNERKTILFSNINVIPYPNELNKKLFKVIMDEKYKTKTYRFNGKKELYIELLDDKIFILTES